MIVYVTIVPRPASFLRSIFPRLFRPHRGQTIRGGKSKVPQLPPLLPTRLYREGISRQKRGIAISVPPREQVDDGGPARAPERVREAEARIRHLPLRRFPAELTDDLDGLRHAGRPHRVAARLEPAGRVHADPRAERGLA